MDDRERLGALRAQMSNVCSMFALGMVMFDLTEELGDPAAGGQLGRRAGSLPCAGSVPGG